MLKKLKAHYRPQGERKVEIPYFVKNTHAYTAIDNVCVAPKFMY